MKYPIDLHGHWRHLTRRPASREPVVDGVRAIAVLWVVLFHLVYFHLGHFTPQVRSIFTGTFTVWTSRGDLGVDLFFVISGFLMGTILLGEWRRTGRIVVARFYARRFLRLIPAYAAVMILGLYMLRNAAHLPPSGNAEHLWANLLYVNNFLPVTKQYMGWCWSLAIEEQFYLVLPAALLVFLGPGRRRTSLLVAGLVASGLIQLAIMRAHGFAPPFMDAPGMPSWNIRFDTLYDKPYARFGGLLSGFLGAYLASCHADAVQRFFARRHLVTVLLLASLAAMLHIAFVAGSAAMFAAMPPWGAQLWWALHRDVFSVATMFVILAAIRAPEVLGGRVSAALSWRGFHPIAQLSYSIYLVHPMVFLWLFPRLAPVLGGTLGGYGAMAADSGIGVLIVLGIAILLYVTVERPCIELRSRPWVQNLGASREKPALEPAS